VLIHGGSGWDVTSIITALSQILMEKRFRTMKGLCQLIEKEWLTTGHPFSTRHAHYGPASSHERAPVFLMFLDSLHHIFLQFPRAFEFNEDFLLALHEHSMASQYATFYFDNSVERHKSGFENINSLWTYLLDPKQHQLYANPLYDPASTGDWIRASFRPQLIDVWREMYCWPSVIYLSPDKIRRDDVVDCSVELNTVNAELESVLKELASLEASKQS